MVGAEPLANRLKVFFACWEAVRRVNHVPRLSDRLTRFFEKSRLLSQLRIIQASELPGPTPNKPLDLESLRKTLLELGGPLTQARKQGAFLNVWSTAGLKRDEVRNAAVLASLFNPYSYPETGPDFLWTFLQRAMPSGPPPFLNEAELRKGYTVRTEDYPLGQTDNRVDLSIEGCEFILIIEVKIDAPEGLAQLERYDEVLQTKAKLFKKRPALIYLSPRRPKSPPAEITHATWSDVVSAARQVGRKHTSADRSLVSTLLLHFATHATAFA